MNPIKRLFGRIRKPDLRVQVEAAYGTEFVENIYDKMNQGIPVGGLIETIVYLEMIEKVMAGEDG